MPAEPITRVPERATGQGVAFAGAAPARRIALWRLRRNARAGFALSAEAAGGPAASWTRAEQGPMILKRRARVPTAKNKEGEDHERSTDRSKGLQRTF